MQERGITHVIHLAALQVPFVRANPPLGASVNVVGTVVVFEAVRALGPLTGTLAYASSVAAYDPPKPGHEYEQRGTPATLYGVFKRANEETAGVYWADHEIPSIGLRPHTVYGLGRDQGVTSAPTKAMLAAASGTSYQVPYGGRAELQHARDVARQFIATSRTPVEGAIVLDPPGSPVAMSDVIDAIHAVVPESADSVGFDDVVGDRRARQGRLGAVRRADRRPPDDPAARGRDRDDRELPRPPRARPREARVRRSAAGSTARRSRSGATSPCRSATGRSRAPTSGGPSRTRPVPAVLMRTPYGKERGVPIGGAGSRNRGGRGLRRRGPGRARHGHLGRRVRAVRERGATTASTRSPGSPSSRGATAGS